VYQNFADYYFDPDSTGPMSFGGIFGTLLSAGLTTDGHDTESFLKFDAPAAGYTAAQVASAKFRIYATSATAVGFGTMPTPRIRFNRPAQGRHGLAESTTTWNSRPASVGAILASVTYDHVNQWLEFDITNLFKDWLNNPSSNFGLMLREDAPVSVPTDFRVGVFYSSAYSNASLRPLIEVTAVPEPSSIPWRRWALWGLHREIAS